ASSRRRSSELTEMRTVSASAAAGAGGAAGVPGGRGVDGADAGSRLACGMRGAGAGSWLGADVRAAGVGATAFAVGAAVIADISFSARCATSIAFAVGALSPRFHEAKTLSSD